MLTLTAEDVVAIHDTIIDPKEIQGLAPDKSLESVLTRVSNRLQYGLIDDVYELAASYGVCLAIGHAFNDANKRTAFQCMDVILDLHGIELHYATEEAGNMIIRVVTGSADEADLANWLRRQHREQCAPATVPIS